MRGFRRLHSIQEENATEGCTSAGLE
jgi:hypothetical protein